jgi:hypothetical protein
MAINLKQNADLSAGLQGTDGDEGGFITHVFNWNAIANTSAAFLTVSGPVFNRRMIVKAITYVNDTAATNAVTAALWKAPSATALASGVALHTGTANLQLTAATNGSLTLSTVAGALDIAAGSRIGFVISATPGAAGVGTITVTLAPA